MIKSPGREDYSYRQKSHLDLEELAVTRQREANAAMQQEVDEALGFVSLDEVLMVETALNMPDYLTPRELAKARDILVAREGSGTIRCPDALAHLSTMLLVETDNIENLMGATYQLDEEDLISFTVRE